MKTNLPKRLLIVATTTILLMLSTDAWAERRIQIRERSPALPNLPNVPAAETAIRDILTPPGDYTADTVIWDNHRPPGDLTNGMRIKIRSGASETLTVPDGATVTIISDGAVTNLSTIRINFEGATSTVNWKANYTHTNRSGTAVVLMGEPGTLNISGTIKTTGTGNTINSTGNDITINVTGGLVSSGSGTAVWAVMARSTTINISGGVVSAGTGQAIVLNTNPNAQHTFEVSGGLIIAEGTVVVGTRANVISHEPTSHTGGFIIARRSPNEERGFYKGKNAVNATLPEGITAVWTLQNNVSGIRVRVNNEYFFEHRGVPGLVKLPEIRDGLRLVQHMVNDTIINYSLGYDTALRQAIWVAFVLDTFFLDSVVKRSDKWACCTIIPRQYQPLMPCIQNFAAFRSPSAPSEDTTEYWNYDIGHLIASADRRFDSIAERQTFFITNASPQVAGFNRWLWAQLEKKVREWAKKDSIVALYVVRGPAINPLEAKVRLGNGDSITTGGKNLDTITELNNLIVANWWYMALVQRRKDHSFYGIAFWMENKRHGKGLNTPKRKHAMTIRDLERLTEIDFFPNLNDVHPQDSNREERVETTINWDRWPGILEK